MWYDNELIIFCNNVYVPSRWNYNFLDCILKYFLEQKSGTRTLAHYFALWKIDNSQEKQKIIQIL